MKSLAPALAVLACALHAPQDTEELIRRLGADVLEDRADAEKALLERGEGARGPLERASRAGLAVETPDKSTDAPNVLWNARSAVEALTHSSVILEQDRLIVLSQEAAVRFWRKWALDEGAKRPRR